ncbi:hypothetical protein P692DRAFT_201375462 [Suillus brevipes Sb2]|nr:hypothetical protein P692DRAFT_201375462 [Suillus brevipes Sb2]
MLLIQQQDSGRCSVSFGDRIAFLVATMEWISLSQRSWRQLQICESTRPLKTSCNSYKIEERVPEDTTGSRPCADR